MRADVGSWTWAQRTGGRVTASDRFAQALEVVGVQLARASASWLRRVGLGPARRRRAALHEIREPVTPTARATAALCSEQMPDFLLNHCLRSYAWAALLGARDGVLCDHELLYVSSLLHDIGLVVRAEPSAPAPACFAVSGAVTAARFLEREGWPADRRDVVADAISRHLNVRVTTHQGAEAHLLHEGAALDVVGARFGHVAAEARAAVLDRYPRLGFKCGILPLLEEEAEVRPRSRIHFLMRSLDFGRWVAAAPFAE